MEIIISLFDLLWTMIKGFIMTPGLNILTATALIIGTVRLLTKSKN